MCLPHFIFVSYLLYSNNPHSILLTPSFLTHSVITSIFLAFIPPFCLLPHPYLFSTPLFITISSSPVSSQPIFITTTFLIPIFFNTTIFSALSSSSYLFRYPHLCLHYLLCPYLSHHIFIVLIISILIFLIPIFLVTIFLDLYFLFLLSHVLYAYLKTRCQSHTFLFDLLMTAPAISRSRF